MAPSSPPPAHAWSGATVLVAVRSESTRATLRSALVAQGLTVAAETDDVDAVLALHQAHQPDLVVLDLGPPEISGMVAALEILTLHPEAVLVGCAVGIDRDRVLACRRAGIAHVWLEPVATSTVASFCRARRRGVGRAA